ncbi:hypothetical protein MJO29_002414 [Puccinia striiformis f. sp. tritici]|nr:hypothetical protein Pst134EB_003587 [Puccinia striiformis f. sp. tritici]KAI7966666.1 hypothetical protein MJO29_002414 [Puccinia striiformis f. sp. tritici]KAI9609887.1 hypothetical protein H4Q26_006876 [Puccinia striiformis f. sp. tritici PST-130]
MLAIRISLLLHFIGASSIQVTAIPIGEENCSDRHPHALAKRAYVRAAEPTRMWGEAEAYRAGSTHQFRDRQLLKKISSYKIRGSSQTFIDHTLGSQPVIDQGLLERKKSLQLISETFTLLSQKSERHLPSSVQILKRNLSKLASGPKISDLLGNHIKGGKSSFENSLFDFLLKSFEEDTIEWWFEVYDSWHSLNTKFLDEVSIILNTRSLLPPEELIKDLEKSRLKSQIASLISKNVPRSSLSDVGLLEKWIQKDNKESLDLYTMIDSISPGIWKFCLPEGLSKQGKFDIDFMKHNPIARLSWFLDDLNPKKMIEYAEALIQDRRSITNFSDLMNRQTVLERLYETEPSQKFAEAAWFVQRLGWNDFQKILLEYEKFPEGNRKIRSYGSSRSGTGRQLSNSRIKLSAGTSDLAELSKKEAEGLLRLRELNDLLKTNHLPIIDSKENLSSNMTDWLKQFLTWLNDSKLQLHQGPSWERP